ncbi:MAG: hypothetical protein ACREDS_00275 [Limisphaerales bacterium]
MPPLPDASPNAALCAAALWARAVKLPLATLPPFARAVTLWIAAARAIVMGVPLLPLEFILLMFWYFCFCVSIALARLLLKNSTGIVRRQLMKRDTDVTRKPDAKQGVTFKVCSKVCSKISKRVVRE